MKVPYKSHKSGAGRELAFNRAVAISETAEEFSQESSILSKRTKTFSLDEPIRNIFEWALEEFPYGNICLCPDEGSKEE